MYTKTLALTGAFAVLASAVPMAKRDVVWVTQVEEDVVTVPVTTTVWVDPTGAPQHFGHNHGGHKKQTTVQQTVHVYPSAAPAPSSEAAPSPYSAPSAASAPSSEAAPVAASEQPSSAAPAPSSVYVAPTTSSSVYVAPTTSPSAYVAPTTSSSAYVAPTTSEAPASTSEAAPPSYGGSNSGSGSGLSYGMAKAGTSYSGDFTNYEPGSGACGMTNTTSQPIVAVSHVLFDSYSAEAGGNPNNNPICKQWITITALDGSTMSAQVVDRCVGCAEADLDMPLPFFNTATSNGNGRVHNMKWSFD